jgi:hypothetical protein
MSVGNVGLDWSGRLIPPQISICVVAAGKSRRATVIGHMSRQALINQKIPTLTYVFQPHQTRHEEKRIRRNACHVGTLTTQLTERQVHHEA